VVQIVISITAQVRSEGLFLNCNVSDEKKFSTLQNNLHRKETTLWQRLLLHVMSVQVRATFLESKVVEETLEVALRNADVVAGKDRNGRIECIDFFHASTGSA